MAGDREVASEVEEGLLTDLAGDAVGADQAMGEVGLTGGSGAGLGATDEHGRDRNRGRRGGQAHPIRLWHYIKVPQPRINNLRVILGQNRGKIPQIACPFVKDGLEREEKTKEKSRVTWGNCSVQRFGRVLRTNRGLSACECAEALGKASASPFWSVRNKKPGKLFQ